MTRQHDTCVFSKTFKRRFAAILVKKKLWEKDALVEDSVDNDMVRSL